MLISDVAELLIDVVQRSIVGPVSFTYEPWSEDTSQKFVCWKSCECAECPSLQCRLLNLYQNLSIPSGYFHLVSCMSIFERPFVKRFDLCYRTVVLSVCLVSNVGVLWPNGWVDQNATWYGGRPRPRPDSVRWDPASSRGPQHPLPKIFGPCLLWSNSRLDQDATWYWGRPRPWPYCVRWGPSLPSP